MNRKFIGIGIISVFAAAIIFGTVGSVMEVIEAATPLPTSDGSYVPRLAADADDNPAIAALKYACPFH
jgi:hypothetical protein